MRLLATLTFASLLISGTAHAQVGRWRIEDRTLLTDFSVITAVAGNQRHVFLATTNGLLVYDYQFDRWEPPVTRLEGYPDATPQVALADPTDESVWVGTDRGLFHYRVALRNSESFTVPGGVWGLMFDADRTFDGIYVATSGGWEFLSRGSGVLRRPFDVPRNQLTPPTLESVLNRFPSIDARRGMLLQDRRMRNFRFTSAFIIPNRERAILGTDGMWAVSSDPLRGSDEQLRFGLVSRGAGAVAPTGGGIWVGSYDGNDGRSGFTYVDDQAQFFRYDEGPTSTGYAFDRVLDLTVRDDVLWAATDNGLWVVDPNRGIPLVYDSDLPSRFVTSLEWQGDLLWVGTDRGLASVDAAGVVSDDYGTVGSAVLDLAVVSDTLWVATQIGLALMTSEMNTVGVPAEVTEQFELGGRIHALTSTGDTLVVATRSRLLWRAAGVWNEDRRVSAVGEITSLTAYDGTVYVGGSAGFAVLRLGGGIRIHNLAGDLPAPVLDLAVRGSTLWIATELGLVRFDRRAVE